MSKHIVLYTYSQSPLNVLMPYFAVQNNISIVDEKKISVDFSECCDELWIDSYIDFYDHRLVNPKYLYQFFLRIQSVLDTSKISVIRLLQNYPYYTSCPKLSKVCYFYQMFTKYFANIYRVLPVFIPDILEPSYTNHPYNILKNTDLMVSWKKDSLFRIIDQRDIIYSLIDYKLSNKPLLLSGLKVTLLDLSHKITHVFGKVCPRFEDAYTLFVIDDLSGDIQSNTIYNLDNICINQL